MSNTLKRTVAINYSIFETGTRLRREVFTDRAAYLTQTNYESKEITLAASEQITLLGIEGFFFLKVDNPLQVKINSSDYFLVQDAIFIYAALNEVILFNPSTTPVSCKLINS